ncbi:MAG TPA: hypothetical protein VG939_06500, partial [Caulobacteraceae bacterium]|nr:hypothetical protein [Caulobacteraceae bacterium]
MDVTVQAIELSADRRRVVVTWADGVASAAPAPWLADNVEDGFDAASGHRLEGPAALDGVLAGVRLDGEALAVRF